jgi:hypothetical protein
LAALGAGAFSQVQPRLGAKKRSEVRKKFNRENLHFYGKY